MGKHITIGVAGHVDHGKSALVRCLTGIDTDRLQEEKTRGMSIESGIAPLNLPTGAQIAMVDVPGHTDFLKNTIRGLSSVDMAILVVAADDGVMPQTLEHIQILDFFGVQDGFIVLSKADLVDEDTLELAELEIREALGGKFLDGKPVIRFSAIDQRGLNEIRKSIEEKAKKIPCKDLQAPFRLWIDQVKSLAGFGTVASGTVLSGTIRQDDTLHLLPSGIETRARSLETHHKKSPEAFPCQRVGINLHKVPLKEINRGMVLVKPGTVNPTYILNVDLQVLQSAKNPIRNRQRVKLYLGTSLTNAMAVIMGKEQLKPGERGLVQFRTMKPVAALPKDPFVISPLNVNTVIAGGKILEISHEKYRKVKARAVTPCLTALQSGDIKEFVDRFFSRNYKQLITARDISQATGLSFTGFEAEISLRVSKGEFIYFKGKGAFKKNHYDSGKKKILNTIENVIRQDPLKKNLNAVEIVSKLETSFDEALLQKMLSELCSENKLMKIDGGFQLQNLKGKFSEKREYLIALLLKYAQKSGVVPFSADTIWKLHDKKFEKDEIQKLLDYLYFQKKLIRLSDKRFLTPEAVEEIKLRVKRVIVEKGGLTLAGSKEILGYGRGVGVPVLEYLDSIGFTFRDGNKRILTK